MPSATSTAAVKSEKFHGINREDWAYSMVQKMGWKEGVGLGKNNDGITKHLWTKKREDQVGIGAENTNDWGAHSVQTNSYNDILAKLSVIVNTSENEGDESEDDSKTSSKKAKSSKKRKEVKKKKKSKSSSSDSESSESEDESSDGKSRKKSAKKQDKKKSGGKKKKSGGKKGKTKESSETSAASESDESDSDLEQKAASSSTDAHASRKAGRSYAAAAVIQQRYAYKRAFMNKTKDVKSYSATDLSQILGYSVPPKQEDEKLISKDAIKKYGKSEVKLSKEEKEEKEEEKKKKSKHERDLEKVPHCEEEDVISTTGVTLKHPILPKPSVLSGILKHMFVHGGFMSHDKEKHKKQDWEFNEETQERIANDAHANKVEGRKGLGFDNDRPTKLGKDFKGAKKTFDSDEDSDASSIKSDDEEEVKPEKSDKKKSKSEKKEKKEKKDKEKKKKKKRARDSDESDSDSDKEVSKKKKKKSNK